MTDGGAGCQPAHLGHQKTANNSIMQQQATHFSTAATAAGSQPTPPTGPACCSYCGAPDIVLDWAQRFKLLVCTPCFRKHERLVSKSNAKSSYLLSDSDLQPLGFVEKQNPQHQKWSSMKQYLVSQVEEVAIAKHSSLDALEEEKQRRLQGRLEQRIQRRQAAEQNVARQQRHEAHLQATLEKYTAATAAAGEAGQQEQEHVFDDPVTGKRKRRFGEGLADVEVEEF